jgi:Zn-dependent protease
MAITALAGPVSNFIITAVALFLFGFLLPLVRSSGDAAMIGVELLYITAHLSLGLGLFNLLPIPPLDGSKVLFSLIPDSAYMKLMRYERYGMILLVILAYTGVTGSFLGNIIDTVFDWFLMIAQAAYQWSYSLFVA